MYLSPTPVVSGMPYAVEDVGGRAPSSVDEFVGTVRLMLVGTTGRHVVAGEATVHGSVVHLTEKGDDGVGKDVRAWRIQAADEGAGFVARSA